MAALFSPFTWLFGVSLRDAECGLQKIPIFLLTGWDFNLFWISTPLSKKHLWVLSMPPNTSAASLTLSRSRKTRPDQSRFGEHRIRRLCSIRTTWSRSWRGWLLIQHGTPPRQSEAHSSPAFSWLGRDTTRWRGSSRGMPYGNDQLGSS